MSDRFVIPTSGLKHLHAQNSVLMDACGIGSLQWTRLDGISIGLIRAIEHIDGLNAKAVADTDLIDDSEAVKAALDAAIDSKAVKDALDAAITEIVKLRQVQDALVEDRDRLKRELNEIKDRHWYADGDRRDRP